MINAVLGFNQAREAFFQITVDKGRSPNLAFLSESSWTLLKFHVGDVCRRHVRSRVCPSNEGVSEPKQKGESFWRIHPAIGIILIYTSILISSFLKVSRTDHQKSISISFMYINDINSTLMIHVRFPELKYGCDLSPSAMPVTNFWNLWPKKRL